MTLATLHDKIKDRSARLGVVGLGYVGLPLACVLAEAGFSVTGLEIRSDRVATINAGRNPIEGHEPGLAELITAVVGQGQLKASADFSSLADADIIFFNVETPVDDTDHQPRYVSLRAACQSVGQVMKPGALIIVESTIAPGTMERVVAPLLAEASGRKLNEGFYLGHCPERVMPGKLLANLRGLSRVCGGSTPETATAMVTLYRSIVQADLDPADCVTAELVKTAENAYRDVNIAFANELALVCEASGGDFLRVRELVNKSPGRNVLLAGAGVGGHCIPKDPWLLAYGAHGQATLNLIPAARTVNEAMPTHMLELAQGLLKAVGRDLRGARVLVLGFAYLEDSDDTRHSPSEALIVALRAAGADVVIHDPWVAEHQGDVLQKATGADAAILMVAHRAYRTLDLGALRTALRTPILVDGRRVFAPDQARAAGLTFRAVGLGIAQ